MGNKISRSKAKSSAKKARSENPAGLVKNGRTESQVTQQDKAILELKKQRDILKQFQKNVDVNHEKERHQVKQFLIEGNRDRAKFILKKKRFREVLMERTQKQLDNIDEICNGLEFAQIELTVFQSLKAGNLALKLVLDEMQSIDEVEQLLEETREGIDKQNEINRLFSDHLSPKDFQDVELELENLVQAQEILSRNDPRPVTPILDASNTYKKEEPIETNELQPEKKASDHENLEVDLIQFPDIPLSPMPQSVAEGLEAAMSKPNQPTNTEASDILVKAEDEIFDVADAETSAGAVDVSQSAFPAVPETPILASPRNGALFEFDATSGVVLVEFSEEPDKNHHNKHNLALELADDMADVPAVLENKKPTHNKKKKKKKGNRNTWV